MVGAYAGSAGLSLGGLVVHMVFAWTQLRGVEVVSGLIRYCGVSIASYLTEVDPIVLFWGIQFMFLDEHGARGVEVAPAVGDAEVFS